MSVARFDALRSKNFAAITGSYTTIGTPLTRNWRMFRITNNTNGDILISADGSTDNLFIPAFSFVLYDIATNTPNVSDLDDLVMSLLTQFYVKYSTAPTSGDVWIEGVYAGGAV